MVEAELIPSQNLYTTDLKEVRHPVSVVRPTGGVGKPTTRDQDAQEILGMHPLVISPGM